MNRRKQPFLRAFLPFALLLILATACGQASGAPLAPPGGFAPLEIPIKTELTVAAASDLQFALSEIATLYEQDHGVAVTLVFGSTGQLAQHVENGAPYDLLAAADLATIDNLAQKGLLIAETVRLYARGYIVLAVNRQAGVQALSLEDLLSPQIRYVAIANPDHAPYGRAAMQALQAVRLWESLQAKLVMGENIRQTLQYVQSGDAQVGIVSRSIADVPEVTWTMIDEALYPPLDQAMAVLAASPQPEEAEAFSGFINSEPGRQILLRYGFILPVEADSPTSGNLAP